MTIAALNSPTNPSSKMIQSRPIIVLDPGHGGADSGAVYKGRAEKNDNLSFAFSVRDYLIGYGAEVYLTRESDSNPSYSERLGLASAKKASAMVSLHRNAFKPETATGIEVWFFDMGQDFKNLSWEILSGVLAVADCANRGIKTGGSPSCHKIIPSCMLELLFLDNTQDNTVFDQNFSAYADAVAKGILKAIGITPVRTDPVPPPAQPVEPPVESILKDFKVGDEVIVTGFLYRDSYGGGRGMFLSGRKSKISRIADPSRKAPYLIDNVLGWVEKDSLSFPDSSAAVVPDRPKNPIVGNIVTLSGAPLYTNSYGGTPARKISGEYVVSMVIPGRAAGVLIGGKIGWIRTQDILSIR